MSKEEKAKLKIQKDREHTREFKELMLRRFLKQKSDE